MRRRTAVAMATATLAVGACGATGGSDSTGSLDGLRAVVAGVRADSSPSAVMSVGECLVGARLRDNPEGLSAALELYGIGAFETLGDDPAWTDPVDCATPHELEVYGVVALPPNVESEIASYGALVNADTRVYRQVDAEVTRGCALAFDPAAVAARSAPLSVDVVPFWGPDAGISVTWTASPAAAWDEGDHWFACLFEQSRPSTLRLADIASGDFPAASRVCLMGTTFVSCARRHDAERLATVRLDRAVAQGQLAGARAVDDAGQVNLGVEAWSALDGVCQRYLDAVAPHHARGLRGVANTYPELFPDPDGNYSVLCSAQAPFGSGPSSAVATASSVFAGR
jgi:hypothetical protein